jgi:hypothetical protein
MGSKNALTGAHEMQRNASASFDFFFQSSVHASSNYKNTEMWQNIKNTAYSHSEPNVWNTDITYRAPPW